MVTSHFVIYPNIVEYNMTKEDRDFLKKQFKEERKYYDKKFEKIDKRFDKIEGRLDKVDGRLDVIETRLDNLEKWTTIADKKFDLVEKKFVDVDERLDKLERYITRRFGEIDSKLDEFFEEIYYMRKVAELHTVKIGRLEVRYKNKD
jgi:chromosome segregation ATPase